MFRRSPAWQERVLQLAAGVFALLCFNNAQIHAEERAPDIEVFVRAGCPHCEAGSIIELLCTAGFPALYTQILTLHQLPMWEYDGYLGLYNLAYIFDDSLMVTIAVVTLSRRKFQESAGRWLKLTSGLVMAGLGAALLLQRKWLI